MHTNKSKSTANDNPVYVSPWNELLAEWQHRPRIIGRDTGLHAATLRRAVTDLDAIGPSEAGDCIQSLVFQLEIFRQRLESFAREIHDLESR